MLLDEPPSWRQRGRPQAIDEAENYREQFVRHRNLGQRKSDIAAVVHDLGAKTAKKRLAELPDHAMPPVLAGTAVLEKTPGNLGQAKGIVKLPIGEKSSLGSDLGTVELKLQSTVEIDP